ncbi:MAG TPA: hypothetical protein GX707_06470 [Epulopiscium sp.]|nr:hypothetical protein [Candidatus Epulonipiscium sp.]
MDQYVIHLSSVMEFENIDSNEYGYWTGKEYTVKGVKQPVTREKKGLEVKIYWNKKVAENALKRCIDKYAGVKTGKVEEINIRVSCK